MILVKYISIYKIQIFHSNLYAMKSCHEIICVKMELVSNVLVSLSPPLPSHHQELVLTSTPYDVDRDSL